MNLKYNLLEASTFDLAFLKSIGKIEFITPERRLLRALKLENTDMPSFWPEVVLLSAALQSAWKAASENLFEALNKIVTIENEEPAFDEEAWKQAQSYYAQAGYRVAQRIKTQAEEIARVTVAKSRDAFTKQIGKLKAEGLNITTGHWEQWLQIATADHIAEFAKRYPDRILHPQLEKQIADIQARPDKHSKTQLFRLKERIDRIYEKDPYWENMPAIEVSRLWHAEAILLASDKGIAAYQIVNPLDEKTCPVCKRLHGLIYNVEDVKPKVQAWANAQTAEEITALFPFPRIADVDRDANPTINDLRDRGFNLPPFHGRCRDEIHYLWRQTTQVYPQKNFDDGLKLYPNDKGKAMQYQTVYDTVKNLTPEELLAKAKTDLKIVNKNFVENLFANPIQEPTGIFAKIKTKQMEDSLASVFTPSWWQVGKGIEEAAAYVGPASELLTDDVYMMLRAYNQAYLEKTLGKNSITLYKFIPDANNGILQTVAEATDEILLKNDVLDCWSQKLSNLQEISKKVPGVIVRQKVEVQDLFVSFDMLVGTSTGSENLFVVLNKKGFRNVSLDNIEKEAWPGGFNSIANPIKPKVTQEAYPQGFKYKHVSDNAVIAYQEAFDAYDKMSKAAIEKLVDQTPSIMKSLQEITNEESLNYFSNAQQFFRSQVKKFENKEVNLATKTTELITKFPELENAFGDTMYVNLKALNDVYVKKIMTSKKKTVDLMFSINSEEIGYSITQAVEKGKKSMQFGYVQGFDFWTSDYQTAKNAGAVILKKQVKADEIMFVPGFLDTPGTSGSYFINNKAKKSFAFDSSVGLSSDSEQFFVPVKLAHETKQITIPISQVTETIPEVIPISEATKAPLAGAEKYTWDNIDKFIEEKKAQQAWKFIGNAKDTLGGAHNKSFYELDDGSVWLFKTSSHKMASDVEEAVYKLSRYLDPDTVPITTIELDGQYGSLQLFRKDVTGSFLGDSLENLTAQQIKDLQREHIIDWLVSNLDGHSENFLKTTGGRVLGIDKGQAFKYFGRDKLDPFAGPGQSFLNGDSHSLPNRMFQAAMKGKIEVNGQDAFDFIKTIENISDNDYKDIFRKYAEARYGAGSKAEKFLEQITERKYNLRKDMEAFYRNFIDGGDFKFLDGVSSIVKDVKAGGFLTEQEAIVLREAEILGWQGKTLKIDKMDIEDQNVLVFTEELKNGEVRTVLKFKTRPEVDQKVVDSLARFGITQNPAQTTSYRLLEDTTNQYGDSILNAVKTVNFHPDGNYNQTKLQIAYDKLTSLKTLAAANPGTEIEKMANYYVDWIEKIQEAVKNKNSLRTFEFFQPKIEKAQALAPTEDIKISITSSAYTKRSLNKGKLKVLNDDVPIHHVRQGLSDMPNYSIKYSDGMKIRYCSWNDANAYSYAPVNYALRGDLEITIPGKPDAELVSKALKRVHSDMGIATNLATTADEELMYLLKQAHITNELNQTTYRTLYESVKDKSAEDQIVALKDYWQKKLKISNLDDYAAYDPNGKYVTGFMDKSVSGGYRQQYRFDITQDMLDKELDGYALTHRLYGQKVSAFLDSILDANGQMISTVEKLRLGVTSGGMSPIADINSGGANYVFTRIAKLDKIQPDDMIVFKKDALRRMDAISYDSDKYGRTTGDTVTNYRKSTIAQFKKCAEWSGNETIFKNTLDILDNVEFFNANTLTDAQAILDVLKKKGIAFLPDGRPVEKAIRIGTQEVF